MARTHLAGDLYNAAVTLPSRQALQRYLIGWREDLINLLASSKLGRKTSELAGTVPRDFPSVDAVLLYAKPITSWTANQLGNITSPRLHAPNLAGIVDYCEKYFSWATREVMTARLKEKLWPGIVLRYLLLVSHYNCSLSHSNFLVENIKLPPIEERYMLSMLPSDPTLSFANIHILHVAGVKLGPGPPIHDPNVNGYLVSVLTESLIKVTTSDNYATPGKITGKQKNTNIWVPASLLRDVMPSLVEKFHRKTHTDPPVMLDIAPVRNIPWIQKLIAEF